MKKSTLQEIWSLISPTSRILLKTPGLAYGTFMPVFATNVVSKEQQEQIKQLLKNQAKFLNTMSLATMSNTTTVTKNK
jgi:hypothetical protein